jgi:hypothetical protein
MPRLLAAVVRTRPCRGGVPAAPLHFMRLPLLLLLPLLHRRLRSLGLQPSSAPCTTPAVRPGSPPRWRSAAALAAAAAPSAQPQPPRAGLAVQPWHLVTLAMERRRSPVLPLTSAPWVLIETR